MNCCKKGASNPFRRDRCRACLMISRPRTGRRQSPGTRRAKSGAKACRRAWMSWRTCRPVFPGRKNAAAECPARHPHRGAEPAAGGSSRDASEPIADATAASPEAVAAVLADQDVPLERPGVQSANAARKKGWPRTALVSVLAAVCLVTGFWFVKLNRADSDAVPSAEEQQEARTRAKARPRCGCAIASWRS